MPRGGDVVSGVFQDIFSVYFGVLVIFWLISCLKPEQQPKRKKKFRNKQERDAEIERQRKEKEKRAEEKKKENEEEEEDNPSSTDTNVKDGESSPDQKENGAKAE